MDLSLARLFLPALFVIGCAGPSQPPATQEPVESTLQENPSEPMKRVTGIGGVFFKSKDPESQRNWYRDHLGLKTDEYGSLFEFRDIDEPETKGYLQWSPFSETTTYFEPSEREFMINYRVENLEWLLGELAKEGVEVVGEMQSFSYGKFAHIMDPEGNKIELWEPVDEGFSEEDEGAATN
jgi:predicted enzyme related to lactoylglutathione lyase